MDDFAREVGEAFEEVASEGMPIAFKLTDDPHTGVVLSPTSFDHLREPGYEGENSIVVVCPRGQFSKPPTEYVREILQVEEGPQQGKWVVTAVNSDLAHFTITAKPSD